MTSRRLAGATFLIGLSLAVAGCAASSRAVSRSSRAPAPIAIPLATGFAGPGASWATVRTGGPSAGGRFWQLVTLDAASGNWRLATPPGVADNAGLAVTSAPDGTLTAGFLPGQLLKFSPLATSTDNGAHWTQGLLPAGLAADPDSLAAGPDGRLLAVTATEVTESDTGAKTWKPLVTLRTLAATADGRHCQLAGLTGVASGPSGSVLISGTCARAGHLGLFSNASGGWQAVPLQLSWANLLSAWNVSGGPQTKPMTVLGLISSAAGVSILADSSTEGGQYLIRGWLAAGSRHWAFFPVAAGGVAPVTSAAGSASGAWAMTLTGGQVLMSPGGSVQAPGPNATIVVSADGSLTALVPEASSIAVWQRAASGSWHRTQVIDVASAPAGQSS